MNEYRCGVCGKAHADIYNRAKCEIECTEKRAEEERKAAELKKAAEYETRKAEVDAAFDLAYDLKSKLIKDYGSYTYSKVVNNPRE